MWRNLACFGLALFASLSAGCIAGSDDSSDDDEEVADNEDALRAEAAIGGHAFGLGVDAPTAVTSPLFAKLKAAWKEGDSKLSTARIVFYLDDAHYDKNKLRAWVDGVKAGGLQPVVALSVLREDASGKHLDPVGRATYRARFADLLTSFPDVAYWGAVNEPDLELTGDSGARAHDAAVYYADAYRTLRRCQNAGHCKGSVLLVAGEFSYQGGNPRKSEAFWRDYASAMSDLVQKKKVHRFPRIWSLHPYMDTIDGELGGTDRFDAFLEGVEEDEHLARGHLRAWMTETGGILHEGSKCSTSGGDLNGHPKKQYDGAKSVFAMQKKGRVDRVFWWQFQQIPKSPVLPNGHPWDSAMADATGTPRAAFCALTKQPLAACKGDAYAFQCQP